MPSGSQVGPPPVPPTPLDLSSSAPPSARAVQHISLASCRFEEPGSGNDAQITDPASQRTVVPLLPVPLVQRQEVLERVRAQGWEALTVEALSQTCSQAYPKSAMHFQEAIGSRTAFRDELRHGCPCCGQWCASPSSVEVHLSRTYVHWTDKRASLMKARNRLPTDTSASMSCDHSRLRRRSPHNTACRPRLPGKRPLWHRAL